MPRNLTAIKAQIALMAFFLPISSSECHRTHTLYSSARARLVPNPTETRTEDPSPTLRSI